MVRAVVGGNWGDEGKGKITDMLGEKADIIVRFQGGANAGHTIINNYGKFALHTSAIRCVLQPYHKHYRQRCCAEYSGTYARRLESVVDRGVPMPKILVSDRAQMVMSYHIDV